MLGGWRFEREVGECVRRAACTDRGGNDMGDRKKQV